jgi:hypothetical protein
VGGLFDFVMNVREMSVFVKRKPLGTNWLHENLVQIFAGEMIASVLEDKTQRSFRP